MANRKTNGGAQEELTRAALRPGFGHGLWDRAEQAELDECGDCGEERGEGEEEERKGQTACGGS